jgi:hypothetical protein
MDTISGSATHDRLSEIRASLTPKVVRAQAITALDDLFRSGSAPEPQPEGFLRGELITMSLTRPTDAAVRAISSLYMPWLGKSFDPSTQSGLNILKPSAKGPMKVLWRNYTPERELVDRLEVFSFRTRIDDGAVDHGLKVLKIDYDSEVNPDFLIRRILDELVQLDDHLYLGKILFRTKQAWRPIGFFSLES